MDHLSFLRDLVAINSVNPSLVEGAPGEQAIANRVAEELRRIGLEVSMEPVARSRPNVVGVLEGRAPGRTLMFCGHLDTVGVRGMRAPFDPIERDGRLYGRGAQDMKGGIAAMIAAAADLARDGLAKGRVIVACVADEEHASLGADALVARWHADAAVVTEPTDLDVVVCHKGFAWIEIEVHGKAAHGSMPDQGEDAILRMGRVLARLEALDRALQAQLPHPLLGTGSLHASTIDGGHELSSYPDRARLRMERRTLPGDSATAPLEEVQAILEAIGREDPSFRAVARPIFSRPAYQLAGDQPIRTTLEAIARQHAPASRVRGTTFWTDAAVLGGAGIPAVIFGPGGAGLHSPEEYVRIDEVAACRDGLAALARAFC